MRIRYVALCIYEVLKAHFFQIGVLWEPLAFLGFIQNEQKVKALVDLVTIPCA